ncbi:MAG TPA: transcription antitermination factor NusB [Parachlamydiales bacterium]|nr:transcription antitermination factor NusB [Parachlamydiales bacterium]
MALPPQKFREIVFQILFSRDFSLAEPQEMIALLMKELKVTKKIVMEAAARAHLVENHVEELDKMISRFSTEYSFERISRAEKSVLRLGAFELLHDSTIPPKVAIAEAIRICRKFGSPESSKFINGLLDGIYHAITPAGALA